MGFYPGFVRRQVDDVIVPDVAFMDQTLLKPATFSAIVDIEEALSELGYDSTKLKAIADDIKEYAYNEVAYVAMAAYSQQVDAPSLLEIAVSRMREKGVIVADFDTSFGNIFRHPGVTKDLCVIHARRQSAE